MTGEKQQFHELLLAGDYSTWQRFMAVMEPMLIDKVRRFAENEEHATSIAHDIILGFVANLYKAVTGKEPARTYIRPLDDRFACTLSAPALKPEYQDTPLENIAVDMLAFNPPEPGIIIRLKPHGPAKVLRHDRANVSYAGQIFESLGLAAAAIQDSWKAAPELATDPALPQ